MKQLKGYQPLCMMNDKVLLYKKGRLLKYDEFTNSYQATMNIKLSFAMGIKERFRLLSRIFRADIRSAIALDEDKILFLSNKCLYYAAFNEKKVQKLFTMKKCFSDPINLCIPLKGTEHIALFGDYGNNAVREPVSIYGVRRDLSVRILYTFQMNTVRHIHNIICDEFKDGYYVFTGDNEKNAGIYWTDKTFRVMKPVFTGDQKARAVCGFMTDRGLLYTTDSVSEQNYIFLLSEGNEGLVLKIVAEINGSCIYSVKYSSGYVFSTTVESEESNGNKILNLLSMKRGKGILSENVELVQVSERFESKVIAAYKKDRLPYKLFQYGVVRFPSGLEHYDKLIGYPCAVKKFDGSTVFYESGV